jgi:thiol-disulfide isomerase/thioredoxin
MFDVSQIRKRTVAADEYIDGSDSPFKEKFLERKQTYQLNIETVEQLKLFARKYLAIAFSAVWCKDCVSTIPVLALVSEKTGLEVRIFGSLKKNALGHSHKWRIPPSPPEVELYNIEKLPTILILDLDGREIGRIVENSKTQPTLEQELLEIIKLQK